MIVGTCYVFLAVSTFFTNNGYPNSWQEIFLKSKQQNILVFVDFNTVR